MFDRTKMSFMQNANERSKNGKFTSNFTLSHPNVRKLLEREKHFDAVIAEAFFMEAIYGLASHYNCTLIASSTFSTSKWTNDLTQTPMEYAYVPNNFAKLSQKMNFLQRTYNLMISTYENIFLQLVHYRGQV